MALLNQFKEILQDMKNPKRLKVLNLKIKNLTAKIKKIEKNKFLDNGRVNMDVVIEIQNINNDIQAAKKQIKFIKQKKCYLGDVFESVNILETKV